MEQSIMVRLCGIQYIIAGSTSSQKNDPRRRQTLAAQSGPRMALIV
jgi:hypothetical protein